MTYWKDSLRPSSSHHCQISYITISHALLVAVCIFMLPILVPAVEHVQLTTTEPIKCFRHASLVLPPLDNVLPVLVLQLNMRGLPCSPSHSSVRRVSCNPGLSVPSGLGRTVVELLLILSGDIETNPGHVGKISCLCNMVCIVYYCVVYDVARWCRQTELALLRMFAR